MWFALASLLCGVAPSVQVLIAARALQGVGGALLTPGSLAILQASFAEDDRAAAIGAWSGLGGLATAIGPFLGGYLIGAVSWRLVFFINLPLAVAVLAITARHVPETKAPGPVPRLDIQGAACISGALAGITYGLIAASSYGWGSVQVLVPLGVGAVLLALFIWVEDSEPQPMLPLGVFRSRQFTAANAETFVVYAALGGLLFLLPIVLQVVSGYSPLAAGASLLPVTFIMLTPVVPLRQAGLPDRAPAADVGRAAGHRRVVPAVHQDRRVRRLPVRGAARGAGVRAGRGDHGRAADRDRHGRRAGRSRGRRLGGQQRRGPGGRPDRGGGAARAGRHHREQLPAPRALAHGFRMAAVIAAVFCAAGGVLAALTIRNPSRAVCAAASPSGSYCALEAPPLRSSRTPNLETVPVTIPADPEGPS